MSNEEELERELREAFQAEADRAAPDPAAWDSVQARAVRTSGNSPWRWAALAVAAAAAVLVGVVVLWPDDDTRDEVVTAGTATTPTTAPAEVTVSPSPTTIPPAPSTAAPTTPPATTAPVESMPAQAAAVTEDGRLVVLAVSDGTAVEVRELDRGPDPRVVPTEGDISVLGAPTVSPDGLTVYYHSCCEPVVGVLFRVPIDGSAAAEQIGYGSYPALDAAGDRLAYVAYDSIGVRDLATGAESLFPDLEHAGLLLDVAWAADGQSLLYVRQDGAGSQLVRLDLEQATVQVLDESELGLRFPLDEAGSVTVVEQCCLYEGSASAAAATLLQVDPAGGIVADSSVPLPAPLVDRRARGGYDLRTDHDGTLTWTGGGNKGTLGTGYIAAGW